MNLCKYVKDGTIVHVKINDRDMNKRSKIVPYSFVKSKNCERKKK